METFMAVCRSPWCKAHFEYTEKDIQVVDGNNVLPSTCPKCKSFDNELSGGITWSDKEYEGSRFDGTPHEIKYRVTNFRL